MSLPEPDPLPRYLAPLPRWLEDLGLRLAWPIAAINLVGTAFGFWYYRHQFAVEPLLAWPVVPDSPVATLFIGLSLLTWRLGRDREWLHALAFFGCIKLGLWTPVVLLVFADGFSYLPVWLYNFLFWSHLAMVVEAFLIHRYADFTLGGVAVAVAWYLGNDVVDYFVGVVGSPHHTWVPPDPVLEGGAVVGHADPAHGYAAATAVTLTVLATFLALATRVKKLEAGLVGRESPERP